ncbi:helix-turn-helix domain-containing protein [Bacillota bacterium Lsc_1132]
MKAFGNKLKELRRKKKLTQADLAEALGLDQSTISYYERGKKAPEIQTLEKLAAFFNVSIGDLWVSGQYMDPIIAERMKTTSPTITPNELKEKYKLVVDGREATDEEIEEAIRYLIIQRKMKEEGL